jgi:hypothetical protein
MKSTCLLVLQLLLQSTDGSKIADIPDYPTYKNKHTTNTGTNKSCVSCIRSGYNWIFDDTQYWKTAEANIYNTAYAS